MYKGLKPFLAGTLLFSGFKDSFRDFDFSDMEAFGAEGLVSL